jgi:hypothetical protein
MLLLVFNALFLFGDRPVMALWRGTDAACYAA